MTNNFHVKRPVRHPCLSFEEYHFEIPHLVIKAHCRIYTVCLSLQFRLIGYDPFVYHFENNISNRPNSRSAICLIKSISKPHPRACSTLGIRTRLRAAYPYLLDFNTPMLINSFPISILKTYFNPIFIFSF